MYCLKQVDIIAAISCLIASLMWDIFLLKLLSVVLIAFELKNFWWNRVERERKRSLEASITSSTNDVMKGSSHTITVMIPEKSMPSHFNWTRDTIDLSKSVPGKYLFGNLPNPSLTIINFSSKDAGEYICHVHNDITNESSNSLHLNCIESLTIHITTANEYVANGRDHTINCTISGTPKATRLSWSKLSNSGQEQVINACKYPEKYLGGTLDNPTLTVIGFNFDDDGKYLCKVENSAGETQSNTVQLSCIEKLLVHTKINETDIETDSKKTIECTLSGRATSILWLRIPHGTVKHEIESSGCLRGTLSPQSILIDEIRSEHGGMYICCAANEAGIVSSNEIVVHYRRNSSETEEACDNYHRLVGCIMGIGINVLRNYFENCVLQGNSFTDYLSKRLHILLHICNGFHKKCCKKCDLCKKRQEYDKRNFNKNELDRLFIEDKTKSKHGKKDGVDYCCCSYEPLPGVNVNSLDISLMCNIINTFVDKINHESELSSINGIRNIRNEIFHMSDSKSIGTCDFNTMWSKLSSNITIIAIRTSKEEEIKVKEQISHEEKKVRVSEDDLKHKQLCLDYWRDKCLEFEQHQADKFETHFGEVFRDMLNASDDNTAFGSISEIVKSMGHYNSEDGSYEIEICGNVGATNLFKEKEIATLSGIKEETSSLQTGEDVVMNESNDNNVVRNYSDERSETTYSTSEETKTIPVLFNIDVPNDWDMDKIMKTVEDIRNSNTDDDIKIKSYSLTDLQIIAEILKRKLPKMKIQPAIGNFIKRILKGLQADTKEKALIKVSVLAPEKLKLQLIKKEANVLKGSRHTIVCEISGKPRATKIWWTKNDVEQIDGDSDGLKATLVFEEFLLTDEGCYKCHATNPAGTFYSDPMSLICIGVPIIQISTEKQPVIRKSNQTLTCKVSGKPPPNQVSWKKIINGIETEIDLQKEKYAGGTINCPSLTIKNFDTEDEGTYICQATNEAGKGCSQTLQLSYIERPTVLINNGRQTVIRGCNHTIKCTISGKPPPSIIAWIKGSNGDETFIDDLASEKYSGGTINCPSLTIKDFDKSNEGTYICQATNDVGNGRSEGIFISCIEKPDIVIHISADEQQVNNGSDFTLACTISGTTEKNEISWIKNAKILDLQPEKYSGGTIDSPSLTIKNFDKEDEGTYICQAANEAGQGKSKEILLSCIEKLPVHKQQANTGSNQLLRYEASTKQTVQTIVWIKKGAGGEEIVDLTNKTKYSGGTTSRRSLRIKDIDTSDEGIYFCKASNESMSWSSREIHLSCYDSVLNTDHDTTTTAENKFIQLGNQKFEKCNYFKLDSCATENGVIFNDGNIVLHDRNSKQLRVIDQEGKEQDTFNIETEHIASPTIRIEPFGESRVAIYKTEENSDFNYIILYNIKTKQTESKQKIKRYYRSFSVLEDHFILSDTTSNIYILDDNCKKIYEQNLFLTGTIILHTTNKSMFAVDRDGKLYGYAYHKENDSNRFTKVFESKLPNPEMITSCTSVKGDKLLIITDKIYLFHTNIQKAEATVVDLAFDLRAPQIISYNICCGKLLICDADKGVFLFNECRL